MQSSKQITVQKWKHEFHKNSIKHIQKQIDVEANFQSYTKSQLTEHLNKINTDSLNLDNALIQVISCAKMQLIKHKRII